MLLLPREYHATCTILVQFHMYHATSTTWVPCHLYHVSTLAHVPCEYHTSCTMRVQCHVSCGGPCHMFSVGYHFIWAMWVQHEKCSKHKGSFLSILNSKNATNIQIPKGGSKQKRTCTANLTKMVFNWHHWVISDA